MDLVKLSIQRPVGVSVGVLLTVMFGLIGLTAIPVQLTPSIDRPIITVTTEWPGRSPESIVEDITKRQEEELKNVANLKRLRSVSRQGESEITLEFYLGSDVSRALQEVSDSLRQVADYPDEVEEPKIKAADGASENAIAWIIIQVDPDRAHEFPGFDVTTLFDAIEDRIKPELERIDGVAEVNVFGGREREARVYVDPVALAQRGLAYTDVVSALRRENQNVSAGTIAEGKRDYRVRLLGRFSEPSQILETPIAARDGRFVYVKDVASVEIGHEKKRGFVRSFGVPAIAMNVIRQNNANVVDVMKELRARLDVIRAEVVPALPDAASAHVGPALTIRQVYDETVYINSAVSLVSSNIVVGGGIACLVLLVFLRSFTPTAIIAVSIPVSVLGTFLVMLAMGRTLNVISLAGLAFAVGMVVDNAIVVLENIDRRIRLGEPPATAALRGGREVWGAILASTLTTAAVFIPVLTIQEEAGQLFRDIALAIVASVTFSLLVSITAIPAAAALALRPRRHPAHTPPHAQAPMPPGPFAPLDRAASAINRGLASAVHWAITGPRAFTVAPALVAAMTLASLAGSYLLAPPLDYLPAGNRNLVFGALLTPPGLSVDQFESIAARIEADIKPYADASLANPQSVAALAPIDRLPPQPGEPAPPPFAPVPVDNFFVGSFAGGMFVGATSEDEQVVKPIGSLVSNAMNTIPDSFGGAQQSSIFGRGASGGNTVDLEISGPDLARVAAAADFMYQIAGRAYGFGRAVTADPANFNLTQQEYRVVLTDRAREMGVRNEEIGTVIRALFDGAFVGDYKLMDENIDLVVLPRGGRLEFKEQLGQVPIATPSGRVAPIDAIANLLPANAPQDIQRIEELPAVTIRFQPPDGTTVDEMKAQIESGIIAPARQAGLIDRSMTIALEGTAAKLDEVRAALFGASSPSTSTSTATAPAPTPAGSSPAQAQPLSPPARLTRVASWSLAAAVAITGLAASAYAIVRALRRRSGPIAWGAVGALLLALALGLPLLLLGQQPGLALARMVWALAVTYLLMAALFESFTYPLVIMFSVPLAVVGGFAGLALVHHWTLADPTKNPQQLDVLTMLGFVILIGVVVNNAILLVHQALNFMKGIGESDDDSLQPLPPAQAIALSVRSRVRPIFMSALTSVGGMLPLVLFPGPGSEMYRGLGSVVVGGLIVSTLFTLVLVPVLFAITIRASEGLRAAFFSPRPPTPAPVPATAPATTSAAATA